MKTITITHLYAQEMSIYGDRGNSIVLCDWLRVLGYNCNMYSVGVNESLPKHSDFFLIGGGADRDQKAVSDDLKKKKNQLLDTLSSGTPLLAICGGYQLFGSYYIDAQKETREGMNWFDISTESPGSSTKDRCIGTLISKSLHPSISGMFYGFENHGGQTVLHSDATPLARVVRGNGNTYQGAYEGVYKNNTIGTYMHGPVLAKNPSLTQFFIETILGHPLESLPKELSLYTTLHKKLLRL